LRFTPRREIPATLLTKSVLFLLGRNSSWAASKIFHHSCDLLSLLLLLLA
jgi:hypothetical protein